MSAAQEQDRGLRERLVAVGVELVAAEGTGALSLREIARRAGVSHGAPRRYFPTHRELLSAIAREGFTSLAAQAARATGAGPREQLAALARGYLEFALANPGMYELMFRHDLLESGTSGLRDTSLPLFHRLAGLVAQACPGVAEPQVAAAALWANLHGVAQLWSWRSLQLASGSDDLDGMLGRLLEAHLGPVAR
ncbi:TetR/AcrR family transcriptional regulator [Kitasatospora sp. NPDC048365]|uniref:TetR/AcrR family transcriptional regulator n=1 Tax=Kitasatospora sp. NPDC048365 TaxID=3364050 RepID=UPI003719D132